MARMKVFQGQMGFHDSVVAAPSRKAALEAWGTRQDLFSEGLARESDDPEARAAALERPGVVLRRPAGGSGAFTEAAPLPKAPAASKAGAGRSRPRPDRAELTAAEKALAAAEREHALDLKAFQKAMRDLEARGRKLEADHGVRMRQLEQAERKARRAFEDAGGR